MRTLIISGTVAVAMVAGAAGSAQAQSTIADEIGGPLLSLASGYEAGNFYNLSLNVARIDGSVAVGTAVETDTIVDSAGQVRAIDEDAGLGNLGDIETTAVGAINEGTVELGQAAGATSASEELSLDAGDVEIADDVSSFGGSTSDTSSASYEADFYASVGSLSASLNSSTSESFYGPLEDTFAMNVAFNNTDLIDGSVSITGNDAAAESIKTTVAGAVNTGTITSGLTD